MGKYVCDIGGITTASYLDVEGKSFLTFFFKTATFKEETFMTFFFLMFYIRDKPQQNRGFLVLQI